MKINKHNIFLFLMLATLFLACQEMEVEPEIPAIPKPPIVTAPSLPIEAGLKEVIFTQGFQSTQQMKLSQDKSWIYSMYVPPNINEEKVPLVIALHGGNGDTNSSKNFMECLPLPSLTGLNAIIFAPTGGQWWDELHSDRVVEFVRLAKLHWPIDSNKVVVTGYSNGGTGSVYFAKNFPQTFSAAIPMGADYMEGVCPAIPTYMIHGSKDQNYSPEGLKRIVDGLINNGCDIQLHLVTDATHGAACSMNMFLTEAASWLEEKVWKE